MRALAAVLLLTACSSRTPPVSERSESAEPPEPTSEPKASPASVPAVEAVDPGAPAIVVNGHAIDRRTLDLEVERALFPYRSAGRNVDEAFRSRVRRNVIRAVIEREVVRQKAEALSIEPAEAAKEDAWNRAMKRFASREAAEAFAAQVGTTLEAMRTETERLLRLQAVEAHLADSVQVPPAEVKRYYEERLDHFSQPTRIRYSQLFFRIPPGSQHAAIGAKVEAQRALERLKNGESFESLVTERASAPQHGDQGFREEGQIPPPVAAALKDLKKGQSSGVVETEFGLHIVRKTGMKPGGPIPFAEVREGIRNRIAEQRKQAALREALAEWKKEAKVTIPADPEFDLDAALGPAGRMMLPTDKPDARLPEGTTIE